MHTAGTMLGVLLLLSLTSAQCCSGYGIAKLQAFAPFVSVYTSQKQPCSSIHQRRGQVVARQLQERTRSLRGLLILRAAEGDDISFSAMIFRGTTTSVMMIQVNLLFFRCQQCSTQQKFS